MAGNDLAYYMANEDEFNKLTEAQVIALSQGETVEGETAAPETDGAENGETPAPVEEVAEPVVETVVQAKDGKHVIPFAELEDARSKAAQWEAFAREQAALVESLKQAKAEDAKTGGTEAQQAVMAEYAGDFPEVFEDMKGHFKSMIDAEVTAKMADLEAKLNGAIAPMQKAAQESAIDAHFNAIRSAIGDFDQLVESGAVQDWIKTQPSYVQKPAMEVLEKGTASEVIELFSDYKKSLPGAQIVPSNQEMQNRANAVIAKARATKPTSLTDIPSGTQAPIDDDAAEAGMSAAQLFAKFQGMPPDKILKAMSRAI